MTASTDRQPGSFRLRLLRWLAPASPAHDHLLPRFEQETRERLARLSVAIYTIALPFWTFYTITDIWLFTDQIWALLGLRALLLLSTGAGPWLFRRPWAPRHVYPLLLASWAATMAILTAMGVTTGYPAGLYSISLFGAVGLAALLPGPLVIYLALALSVTGIYTAGVAAAGLLGDSSVTQFVFGLAGAPVFFGGAHYYLERQRWENFLTRIQAEQLNARLSDELITARRIQQGLLPPASPGWPTPDLACWSEAAREVGGDFYAYTRRADGRLGFAVGDVSGKGMPAALLMSTSLALLRSTVEAADTPDHLLAQLDRALTVTTRATRQNCALCCVELSQGVATVANAGGIAPLVRHADGSTGWVEVGGLPLGTGMNLLGYRARQVELASGDLLILVSDGIVEAMREDGEIFGFERFERAVAACDAPSAFVAIALLREAVAEFIGPAETHDDMTIVVLRIP